MIQPILYKLKPRMAEVITKLEEDLRSIRTGKANPALIENIIVPYYGTPTPLKNMASIAAPDAFLLVVQPWDVNILTDIENGLRNANLGFGVTSDGHVVRITLPPLTQERRLEFIKLIHQKAESARIVLRNLRQEAWEEVQKEKKNSQIGEDDLYRGESELNKLIESYNINIRDLIGAKEKELKAV